MEKPGIHEQKNERRSEAILKRIHDLRPVLSRQGEVVAGWGVYRGRKLGPYWRLAYWHEGRARAIYLGRWSALVQKVRSLLDQWQEPFRRHRQWGEVRRSAKAALRASKIRMAADLARVGLRLQGYEVRGWRKLRLPRVPQRVSASMASILTIGVAEPGKTGETVAKRGGDFVSRRAIDVNGCSL